MQNNSSAQGQLQWSPAALALIEMLQAPLGILIELLAPYPDVAIVLSTSWVRVLGYSRARACLPPALASRVIGAVFHSRMNKQEFDAMSRGAQVLSDATRRGVARWLAVDDDNEGWLSVGSSHLVLTNGDLGLAAPKTVQELRHALQMQFGVRHTRPVAVQQALQFQTDRSAWSTHMT